MAFSRSSGVMASRNFLAMANSSSPKSGAPCSTKASDSSLEAVGLGMKSLIPPSTLMFTLVSVIRAAPWAIFFTRSRISSQTASLGPLTKYSRDAVS